MCQHRVGYLHKAGDVGPFQDVYKRQKPENADQGQYPLKIYEDEEAAKFITGAAYHNYGGNKDELLTIHQARPDKELLFTETSIGTWNDGRNLEVRLIDDMREVALGTVNTVSYTHLDVYKRQTTAPARSPHP